MSEQYHKNFMHQLRDGELYSHWQDVPQPSQDLQNGLDSFEETQNYGHAE